MRGKVKLSEIIAVCEILHAKNIGDVGFCDLQNALENVGVEIENDCLSLSAIQRSLVAKQLKGVS